MPASVGLLSNDSVASKRQATVNKFQASRSKDKLDFLYYSYYHVLGGAMQHQTFTENDVATNIRTAHFPFNCLYRLTAIRAQDLLHQSLSHIVLTTRFCRPLVSTFSFYISRQCRTVQCHSNAVGHNSPCELCWTFPCRFSHPLAKCNVMPLFLENTLRASTDCALLRILTYPSVRRTLEVEVVFSKERGRSICRNSGELDSKPWPSESTKYEYVLCIYKNIVK
jgi:hypothetical protein